jgi:FtsP/CotA-like multicopper oxidase with cupredoxin domain
MHSATRIVSAFGGLVLLSVTVWAQGAFQNPPELVHKNGHLKAVIQLSDGKRAVPNGNSQTQLRMFQGWPYDEPNAKPAPDEAKVAPGPTLRTRVGGRVDVMFLNKVDESKFAYTVDGEESPGSSECDQSGQYPPPAPKPPDPKKTELFPDCFHGSSTSNLHFHGTHTSPDGLGDNVLVQVLPNKNVKPSDFQADFDKIFNAAKPPQHWRQMPEHYQLTQLGYTAEQIMKAAAIHETLKPKGLVAEYDAEQAARAQGAGRKPPASLWEADRKQIIIGQWPQFLVGAFPNALEIPDYKNGTAGLRAGQAPGTHWYHAHKHGSTSLHIFNGLAGALIIEGDYDDKLHAFFDKQRLANRKMVEQVMVFQQIVPSQNLEKVIGGGTGDNPQSGNNQKLINGKINPTIQMAPGEIQLWRVVNAMGGGQKGTLDFTLFQSMLSAGFQIKQVAYDGVQFSWDNYLGQPFFPSRAGAARFPSGIPAKNVPPGLTLAAGNRADLLVKAPATTGISRFQISGDFGGVNLAATPPVPLGMPFLVLTVNVTGPAEAMNFFTAPADKSAYPVMPAFLENLAPPPAGNVRTLTFSSTAGPGGPPTPPQFTIDNHRFALTPDGKPVSPNSNVDQCQPVNTTWDWTLKNTSVSPNQVHPFHIHINPFQILEINYTDAQGNPAKYTTPKGGTPIWSDVVNIPVNGSVLIRQAFYDFTGTYVIHCHILAHEDRGMMQLVRTIPAGADPAKACKLNGVQHH